MPRLLRFSTFEATKGSGEQSRTHGFSVISTRGFVPRSPPQCPGELAAKAISLLWGRLLGSYLTFTQPNVAPFVVQLEDNDHLSGTLLSPNGSSDIPSTLAVSDAEWGSGFACPVVDELIIHFFLNNEPFDTFAWIIAFCLLDKLQLQYYVHQQVRQITAFHPDRDIAHTAIGTDSAVQENQPPFRLFANYTCEALFTFYTLALKWHLDYSVTLNYLVNLLPHHRRERKRILLSTVALERKILRQLKYNCFIHGDQVIQLLDHFLSLTERNYILSAVLR